MLERIVFGVLASGLYLGLFWGLVWQGGARGAEYFKAILLVHGIGIAILGAAFGLVWSIIKIWG